MCRVPSRASVEGELYGWYTMAAFMGISLGFMALMLEELPAYLLRHLRKEYWLGFTLFVTDYQQHMPHTMV